MNYGVARKRNNPYLRLVNPDRGVAWNYSTAAESAVTPWANSYQAQTWDAVLGIYRIVIPAGLQPGRWLALEYDNAAPADTDVALPESREFTKDPCGGFSPAIPILINP